MNKNTKIFLTINLLLIIFLFTLVICFNDIVYGIDIKVSEIIWRFRNPLLTDIMKMISFLANYKFIICVLIISVIINRSILFPLDMAISTSINTILKKIIRRSRPLNILVVEKSYSFPSGHASASVSFYGFIIYKVYNMKINKTIKTIIISLLSLLILLIGFSRIYLGAHYLTDVITGYLVSLEFLIIYLYLIGTKK